MMPTPSAKSPRTACCKVLSLSALALLLVTGCGAKEELSPSSGPASSSASASASAGVSAGATAAANESASPEASATETQRYSGGSKAPEGEYRAADEHGPAQNVPRPVEPEGMNEESEEGLFKFLGYWAESVNYGIQTGDFTYVSPIIAESHEVDVEYFSWLENLYDHNGWVAGGLRSVVVGDGLLVSQGNGVYTWGGNLEVQNSYIYLNDEMTFTDNSPTKNMGIYFEVKYENNEWEMLNIHSVEE